MFCFVRFYSALLVYMLIFNVLFEDHAKKICSKQILFSKTFQRLKCSFLVMTNTRIIIIKKKTILVNPFLGVSNYGEVKKN